MPRLSNCCWSYVLAARWQAAVRSNTDGVFVGTVPRLPVCDWQAILCWIEAMGGSCIKEAAAKACVSNPMYESRTAMELWIEAGEENTAHKILGCVTVDLRRHVGRPLYACVKTGNVDCQKGKEKEKKHQAL